MPAWACVVLAVAAVGQTPGASSLTPRAYHEISRDASAMLRAEATAASPEDRERAIRGMASLHEELRGDPRLAASDTLKRLKAKLWSRMTRVQRELAAEAKRRGPSPSPLAIGESLQPLAAPMSSDEPSSRSGGTASYLAAASPQLAGAGGGGAANDNSQQLIDLIQRTIRPDFWDAQGGPGSIGYYRPLMALVVRATAEVHGDVGGLLQALRDAGN